MKKKTIISVLTLTAILLVTILSSCSGVLGNDGLHIYVDMPDSNARFIDLSVDAGYVVVVQENRIYSLGTLEGRSYDEFNDGYITMKGIPTGDYVVVVVLMDGGLEGSMVGFKMAGVTIKKGPNYLPITVGPGLTGLTVGNLDDVDVLFNPTKLRNEFSDVTVRLGADDQGYPAIFVGGTTATGIGQIDLSFVGTPSPPSISIASGSGERFWADDEDGITHFLSVILDN